MTNYDQPRRILTPAVVLCVAVVLLLPVLYVLSAGPVYWLVNHGYVGMDTANWLLLIYAPLRLPLERGMHFRDAFEWYQALWIGHCRDAPHSPSI